MSKRSSAFGPTQKEIGEALGIAQTTVALALNPKYSSRYAPETVERIRQKAEEMGYRPRKFAQIMRSSRSYMVGILSQTGVYESSRNKLAEMVNALRERNYSTVVADIPWFNSNPQEALSYLLDHSIEGLVFLNLSDQINLSAIRARKLPVVEVNCNVQFGFPQIQEEIGQVYVEITQHHLQNGARRLVLLMNQRDAVSPLPLTLSYTLAARIQGFAEAIAKAGGQLQTDFVGGDIESLLETITQFEKPSGVTGKIIAPLAKPGRDAYAVGRAVATELLSSKNPKDAPDTFVCANDDLAVGVLKACQDLGLNVPKDIRISGYDATVIGEYLTPALTTARAQNQKIAQAAACLLVNTIEQKSSEPEPALLRIPSTPVYRASSGVAPLQAETARAEAKPRKSRVASAKIVMKEED